VRAGLKTERFGKAKRCQLFKHGAERADSLTVSAKIISSVISHSMEECG
jgi:hypothetical protein